MKLTDELLEQHAAEARDLWLSTLPQQEEVPPHKFSRRFERKMRRLLSCVSAAPPTLTASA